MRPGGLLGLPGLAAGLLCLFPLLAAGAQPDGLAPRHGSGEKKERVGEAGSLSAFKEKKGAPGHRERLDDAYLEPSPAPGPGRAASVHVTAGPFTSIQVNVDASGANIPGDAANEPSIAVDPTAPNRLVIGWRQFDNVASNFRQAGVARSLDGGRTWTAGVIDPQAFRTDPVLTADASGTFYYMSLTMDPNGVYLCDLFTSTDGGLTWTGPDPAAGGDKQWVTVDGTGGPGAGNLYEFWTPEFSYFDPAQFTRSLDGGTIFDPPIQLQGRAGERALIWGTLAAAGDGRLYVAGFEDTTQLKVAVARITRPADEPFERDVIGVEYDESGANFFKGKGATDWSVNPVGLAGQMWVATNPVTGRIYLAASVSSDAFAELDVHFARSIDDAGGRLIFQDAVRVNDDPPGNGADQWFATMSVAPGGRIDLVWNDTRNNPGGPRCFPTASSCHSELFYSFSSDEGATWSPAVPITPPWDSLIGWPNQRKIGDYYHLVSDEVGAHLAFAATFNGEQDIYYMRIGDYDCNGNGIGDGDDLLAGTSPDCNANAIPDECDWASGVLPGAETCDGIDNDCDGTTDAEFATGSPCDGTGACGAGVVECATFTTTRCSTDPGGSADESTVEICDGLDNSCDGLIDGGDLDGDGVALACGDCDDADPGAFAVPGEIDSLTVSSIPGGHRFAWEDQWPLSGSSTVYDVYAGSLAALVPGGDLSTGGCHLDDLGQGAGSPLHHFDLVDPGPPPGEGGYFLVRGQNRCPWGTGSFGSPDRDAGAAQSASPCTGHEVCDDALDNDGDGLTDCQDGDCSGAPGC